MKIAGRCRPSQRRRCTALSDSTVGRTGPQPPAAMGPGSGPGHATIPTRCLALSRAHKGSGRSRRNLEEEGSVDTVSGRGENLLFPKEVGCQRARPRGRGHLPHPIASLGLTEIDATRSGPGGFRDLPRARRVPSQACGPLNTRSESSQRRRWRSAVRRGLGANPNRLEPPSRSNTVLRPFDTLRSWRVL
jgi:hypothetical protein